MRIRRTEEGLTFLLGARETRLVLSTLKLYPRMPVSHHQLSKSEKIPDGQAAQALLDDAVREQRRANRRELEKLLNDPERFAKTKSGSRLKLSYSDAEWLLQVLNDIRVGSWVLLGSPELKFDPESIAPEELKLYWEMELAGMLEMQLISAMNVGP